MQQQTSGLASANALASFLHVFSSTRQYCFSWN